jgi:hypothetical protein
LLTGIPLDSTIYTAISFSSFVIFSVGERNISSDKVS